MGYFKALTNNESILPTLRRALDDMNEVHFFAAMREHAASKVLPDQISDPIQAAALQGSWLKGYSHAIDDTMHFFEKFIYKDTELTEPDFGALNELLRKKGITQDEYTKLKAKLTKRQ